MSDSRARYKLSDGRTVSVPGANAETAQKVWRQKGLSFELLTPALPAQPDKTTAGEAFGRGAAQGASAGMSDEAFGFGAWLAGETPRVSRAGAPLPDRSYAESRDVDRAQNRQAALEHPVASAAGEIIGAAPSAIALGGGAAAATRAARMAPAVARFAAPIATGAVEGGAQGAGRSEATTAQGVAQDAAIGAGTGAAAGVVGEVAAPIVAKGARALAFGADSAAGGMRGEAMRQKLAASGAERGRLKQLFARDGGHERYAEGAERLGIGKNRAKVIPATVSQHVDDAIDAGAKANAAKNAIAEQIRDAPIDGAEIAARIRALGKNAGDGKAANALRTQLERHARTFDTLGTVPFSRMNHSRQTLGGQLKMDANTLQQDVNLQVYGTLNEAMADAGERVQPGLGKAWRQANEDEHVAITLRQTGENKLNTSGNRVLSPSDMAAGATAAVASGDPLIIAGALGANRLLRNREHAALYTFLNRGSQGLRATGKGLGAAADVLEGVTPPVAPAAPGRPGAPSFGRDFPGEDTPTLPPMQGPAPAPPVRPVQRPGGPAFGPDFPGDNTPTMRAPAPPAARRPFTTDAARAGYAQPAAVAAGSNAQMSQPAASEADAMADPKYGALIAGKPQSERGFVIGVLSSQDPEFRARQREAAHKRSKADEHAR